MSRYGTSPWRFLTQRNGRPTAADHALTATFAAGDVPDGWRVIGHVEAGEPIVLVDLAVVDADECGELIADSYRARAPRKLVAQLDGNEAQK